MVPPVADQVTAGDVTLWLLQVAWTVNCWVMPTWSEGLRGWIRRLVRLGAPPATNTVAVSARTAPFAVVAITRNVPGVLPAIYAPPEMAPPVALQVTGGPPLPPLVQ